MLRLNLLVLMFIWPLAAASQESGQQIVDRAAFVETVAGRNLSRLGIGIQLSPDGTISGRAYGAEVSGSWRWEGSRFCREMRWGDRTFEDACQSVILRGERVYFRPESGDAVYLVLN